MGIIAMILGFSISIYRLKRYPDRASGKNVGMVLPGVEPGTPKDKLLYIGSPFGAGLVGILWIIMEIF